MLFELKSRWSGEVLFKLECGSLRLCVEAAVRSGADLSGAVLSGAVLSRADLSRAVLSGADLSRAVLSGAVLSGADLSRADLSRADLSGADLSGADLSRAVLSGAVLSGADLSRADLSGAVLSGADLSRADLSGADLSGADLSRADLSRAVLSGAKNVPNDLVLPTGETWWQYLTETVPALLTAGGKSIESFETHWVCHSWENCPIAHAFDAHALGEVPLLLRPRADQFIQFFDANMIPWPLPVKDDVPAPAPV